MLVVMIDMKKTGRRIAALRSSRGIPVRELQRLLGFATPQAVYKWQRGETLPSLESLVALSQVFGVTMDEILVCECREEER